MAETRTTATAPTAMQALPRNRSKSKKISSSSTKVSRETTTPRSKNRRKQNYVVSRKQLTPGPGGDSINRPPRSPYPATSDDETPQHPSHIPTPRTLERLRMEDVDEALDGIREIPNTLHSLIKDKHELIKHGSRNNNKTQSKKSSLDAKFWGVSHRSSSSPHKRRKSVYSTPKGTSNLDDVRQNDDMANETILQRQWEVENAFNLQATISSKRLLDHDLFSSSELFTTLQ